MLLSIVCGLKESTLSFNDVIRKFESVCSILKPLNFTGVELSLLEPEKLDIEKLIEVAESYDLCIPALGTGSTFIRFGYSLGDSDETIRQKAIERISKYINFARETNSKVIIGLIRGRFKYGISPKKERQYIISSMKDCVKIAEDSNVDLVFEPINRFEMDSYNKIAHAVELVEQINSKNLKLLIDSFHTYLEEDPVYIWDYLPKIGKYIGYVHLADSTRRAPGSGHFDFKTFLNLIKKGGYDDFVSIETIMEPSFEDVAKSSSEYLSMIL